MKSMAQKKANGTSDSDSDTETECPTIFENKKIHMNNGVSMPDHIEKPISLTELPNAKEATEMKKNNRASNNQAQENSSSSNFTAAYSTVVKTLPSTNDSPRLFSTDGESQVFDVNAYKLRHKINASQALFVHQSERSQEDIDSISALLQQMPIFRNASVEVCSALAECVHGRWYLQNEVIYHAHELVSESSELYVVLSGLAASRIDDNSVQSTIDNSPIDIRNHNYNQTCDRQNEQGYYAPLIPFQAFGFEAITGQHTRSSTLFAVETLQLLVIPSHDYQRILSQSSNASLNQRLEFLAKLYIFNQCSSRELMRIASCCFEMSLPRNAIIFKQNEHAEDVYMLMKGTVRLIYRADSRLSSKARIKQHSKNSTIDTNPLLLDLGWLHAPDMLGEDSVLDNVPRACFAYAETPIKVLKISRGDFLSKLSASALERARTFCAQVSMSSKSILHKYNDYKKFESIRKKLIEQCLLEQRIRKIGFR